MPEILSASIPQPSAPALSLNLSLLDHLPLGLAWLDAQGVLLHANHRFRSMTGFDQGNLSQAADAVQQLLGWNPTRPWPPPQVRPVPRAPQSGSAARKPGASARSPWLHAAQQGAAFESKAWVTNEDGQDLWLSARLYRQDGASAAASCWVCIVEDLTTLEERDLALMQLGALVDSAGVGLATFQQHGPGGQLGAATRAGGAPTAAPTSPLARGGGSSTLQGIRRDAVVPETLAEYDRLQQALKLGQRAQVQYAISHPEHGLRWLMTTVEPSQLSSGQRTTSVFTQDITEQHEAKARSEQLLHEVTTILQNSPAGIAFLRNDVFVRNNDRLERMLGLQPGQFIGQRFEDVLAPLPQGSSVVEQARQTLLRQSVFDTELEILWQGQIYWYALTVRRLDEPGPVRPTTEAIAVLVDVTRFKRQQQAIESIGRERELMFNLSDVGVAFVQDGRIHRANRALIELLGYEESELTQLDLSRLQTGEAGTDAWWTFTGDWGGEYPVRCAQGKTVWLQITQRAVQPGHPQAGVIMSFVNVDDRHRIEQMLAVQVERNRVILDSVFVGIVTVGDRGIEWMNRSARRMMAGNLADFFARPMSVVATSAIDHPLRNIEHLDELAEGQAHTFECQLHALDGREFWVVGKAVVTLNAQGRRQVTYALLDIDSRRQAENLLEQTQSTLQRALEMAPLAISLHDARTLKVIQINHVASALAGQPHEALIGKSPDEYYPAAQGMRVRSDMEAALVDNALVQREYAWKLHGIERTWDVRYLPLAKPGAPPDQLMMVATDTTEQHAAEKARLEAAIAQREILVREVHHRIKNNLQGVAGLLQQIAVRKPEVAAALGEVVGQVQAIAQVYGLQVGAGGLLRLRDVVKAITSSVQRTFGKAIELHDADTDSAEWILPEAESIPIALCINELLTNAIKHGADRGVRCEVISSAEDVSIVVINHGQLSPEFDLAHLPRGISGLGLVRSLLPRRSAQLDIVQVDDTVRSSIRLTPPGISRESPAVAQAQEPVPGQQIALWPLSS